jgi:hypothetical protein
MDFSISNDKKDVIEGLLSSWFYNVHHLSDDMWEIGWATEAYAS